MEMLLQRQAPDGESVRGRLSNNGVFVAFSVEPTSARVPAGRYQVVLVVPKGGVQPAPRLQSVPGREPVDMHGLIGLQRTERSVCCVDEAMSMVTRLLVMAQQRGEPCFVTVIDEGKV